MIDGSAKVLKLAPCCCLGDEPRRIAGLIGLADRQGWPTRHATYSRQRVPLTSASVWGCQKSASVRTRCFVSSRPRVLPRLVGEIDVQDVEDEDVSGMTVPIARGSVLCWRGTRRAPAQPLRGPL